MVRASVKLLSELGPNLRFPHSSGINGSKHGNMRELRVQHAGRPYRGLFAFDPRRCAILLFYQELLAEIPLHELRQARALSQVKLAQSLRVNQAAISKLEHRTDMYISTLRDYIRVVGGDLEIIARFPGGTVKITNFSGEDHAALQG